ncbi:MAG: hypothetical protein K0S65_4007 [Labilithrix sp.]|nr:hypothetical protein [Labilithrix sp.]
MRRALVVGFILCLAFPASGAARPLLGVHGAVDRFAQLTGQRSQVRHIFFGWGNTRFDQNFPADGRTPMLAMIPTTISPLAIARGSGDDYLFALNDWLARRGGVAYVRPMPEMNGHWNAYCAYTKSGRAKGPAYSTAAFKKAFARIAVLVRGGPAASVNAQLARLKLPPVSRDLPALSGVRIVWNPQGYGSPDLRGNSAQAYYPGDRYVDVVANDLYYIRGKAAWAAAEQLYRAHPSKPYAFAEWGLWGLDAPSFVEEMAQFVRTHRRVELVAYYSGRRGSPWDLASKPRSRAAYRRLIVPLGG